MCFIRPIRLGGSRETIGRGNQPSSTEYLANRAGEISKSTEGRREQPRKRRKTSSPETRRQFESPTPELGVQESEEP